MSDRLYKVGKEFERNRIESTKRQISPPDVKKHSPFHGKVTK